MAITSSRLTMQMNDYRGLSAYEIAVKNGFEGTETEWLESLKGEKGADGDFITVNHKKAADGNISVNGTDIYLYPGMQDKTVTQELEALSESASESASELSTSISAVETVANKKAQILTSVVELPSDSWTKAEGAEYYSQSVTVTGVTADTAATSVVATPTTDREKEEEYLNCGVRATTQGNGTLAFTAVDAPSVDLQANVMVVILGTETTNTESGESAE